MLDVACYDPVSQLLEENHVRLATDGITMSPIVCRLITPGEMDLMARIAGLQIIEMRRPAGSTPSCILRCATDCPGFDPMLDRVQNS